MKRRSLCFVAILACATSAQAEGNAAAAEKLFKAGRAALEAHKYAEAREKFEASLREYPGVGAKINLGTVYTALDELDKAEAMLRAAETESLANGETKRVSLAREGLADVERHKARVRFSFLPGLPEAAEVEIDGRHIGRVDAQQGTPLIKGAHSLRVKVVGEPAHEQRFDVPKNDASQVVPVNLPPAWLSAGDSAKPPSVQKPNAPGSTQRTVGLVVGGVGAAGLVTTGVLVTIYGSSRNWALYTAEEKSTVNSYTYLGIGSAALLATGAVLYFTAPKAAERAATLWMLPTPSGAAAGVGGSF